MSTELKKSQTEETVEQQNNSSPTLSSELINSFETSFIEFKKNFDPDSEESQERLNEMVELLTISDENLEKIKNQNGLKRAYHTVTGKNKKLQRINRQNLLKVQKGAVYFLENLAEQNQLMMKSVHFALKRIEDIQINQEEIKIYLFKLIKKYNKKIENMEYRIESNEQQIENLINQKSDSSNVINYIMGGLFIILGIGLINFPDNNSYSILGISVIVFGITINLFPIIKTNYKKSRDNYNEENYDPKEIKRINENIKPKLKSNLYELLHERYIINKEYLYIIEPLLDRRNKMIEFEKNLGKENIKPEYFIQNIEKILDISPDVLPLIQTHSFNYTEQYVQSVNNIISYIDQISPKDIPGLEIKYKLTHNKKQLLAKSIINNLEKHLKDLKIIQNKRKELIDRLPRYKKLLLEDGFKMYAKYFFQGFFVIPYFLNNDNKFMKEFSEDLISYIDKWEEINNLIDNMLVPLIKNKTKETIDESINDLDVLLNELSEKKINLEKLNNEIEKDLKYHKKENVNLLEN